MLLESLKSKRSPSMRLRSKGRNCCQYLIISSASNQAGITGDDQFVYGSLQVFVPVYLMLSWVLVSVRQKSFG